MVLTTYWDLSQKERSALTEQQVSAYCDIALAEKGVLKPIKPPRYEKPKQANLSPAKTYWSVDVDYRGVAFKTAELAQQFLALEPLRIDSDYDAGSEYKYGKPVLGPPSAVMLFDYNEILAHKAEMSKYNAERKANEGLIEQYKKDCKAAEEATADIWNNWHECRSVQSRYQRVVEVKTEYMALAQGDEGIARGFLEKAFPAEIIAAAEEWFSDGPNADSTPSDSD